MFQQRHPDSFYSHKIMEAILTTENILFIVSALGIIFSIFFYFRNPQIKLEQEDALVNQQLKYFAESVDARFKTMQDNFQSLLLQSNNHIHTVDTKVDRLSTSISEMSNSIVKLGTIIEERVPKK